MFTRESAIASWRAAEIRRVAELNKGLRDTYEREVGDWKLRGGNEPVPSLVVYTFHADRFDALIATDKAADQMPPYITSAVTIPQTAEQILNPHPLAEPANPVGPAFKRNDTPANNYFEVVPGTPIQFGKSIPDVVPGYGFIMIEYRPSPFAAPVPLWMRIATRTAELS